MQNRLLPQENIEYQDYLIMKKERWNPIKLVGSTLKKDKLSKSAPTLRKIDSVSTSDSSNEKDQKHE